MSVNSTITNFKYITVILFSIVVGMSIYIFKSKTSDEEKKQYTTILVKNDNKTILQDLEFLSAKYEQVIFENINLSDDIVAEKKKIQALISEIKNKDLTIVEFNEKLAEIKSKMKLLLDENFKLKDKITKTSVTEKSNAELPKKVKEVYERNKFLEKQNQEVQKIISEESKLSFFNLNATSYKVKNSGKVVATHNAKRANLVVINYTINENKFAKAGQKTLFFQVIDPENKVVGETKAETISNRALLYTFMSKIAYTNKSEDYTQQLPFSSFSKGIYQVNVYDTNGLLAETSFEMK